MQSDVSIWFEVFSWLNFIWLHLLDRILFMLLFDSIAFVQLHLINHFLFDLFAFIQPFYFIWSHLMVHYILLDHIWWPITLYYITFDLIKVLILHLFDFFWVSPLFSCTSKLFDCIVHNVILRERRPYFLSVNWKR